MSQPIDLKEYTQTGLEQLFTSWGLPAYRARQVQKWLWKGVRSFDQMTDISKDVRRLLTEQASLSRLELQTAQTAADGCVKFSWQLPAGGCIESVLIPEREHATLCLSSQLGCAMGCRFCLTARQGLARNLTTAEIINQILEVRAWLGGQSNITNLVFMGMGEPLANFDNVVQALTIITAPWGLNFSHRRVTVSTSGLAPFIPRLGRQVRVNLAVSLNAPDNSLRSNLMPCNQLHPLEEVLAACRDFPLPPHRRITFSYVLLRGVNDSLLHAGQLARLLRGIPAKINLIPFNPHPDLPFAPPTSEAVLAFQEVLIRAQYTTLIRESRGGGIAAACGQLAGQVKRADSSAGLEKPFENVAGCPQT
jgi:23S rRNA (adenine2503-C2)-methyltransferase